MHPRNASERLIFALDVPTGEEALALVRRLEGVVSFYKMGMELLMSGELGGLLERLREHRVFLDLKLAGDIPETIRRAVRLAAAHRATFLTLSNTVSPQAVRAAVEGRGTHELPKLLAVSYLSSMDASDFEEATGRPASELQQHVDGQVRRNLQAGCDGVIASGELIRRVREHHPETLIVSPGIRPAGAGSDDHKRSATPSEALAMGSDYLVVGRPIRDADDPRRAATAIIDEIERASQR